ncbi:MAG: hypothetical protein EZS28_012054 [Streblomastix strix]|uniref:NrS-1 polymerase-like helicase domain-containing protein n=1 Tax=Streblomastix strix TaxID=222440 RepID=A0A5J4WD20_9EUKA|nr:MAG: hypothetical protein EZS28_012054 [Streblomastix strix]
MIQNPGKKSRAAIILQGGQGIGKNRFTDVIAELTNRYGCPNITNIDKFTGNFNSVVENKMFSVLIVMRNYYSKKSVATVMKSIISYPTIRINEKNQPRRTAENVMNIIYVSNADSPVQLDTDDRRHLLCACKTVHQVSEEHKEDVEYFTQLTKKQLINGSQTPVDDIIIEHYEQFKQGIPIALVYQDKPQNWKLTTFMNALQHKCTEQSPRINGKRTRLYVLNEDQQKYYDKMMNEEDIEASNANYQKYKKTIEDDGFIELVAQDVKQE